jgi:hypothetical protein
VAPEKMLDLFERRSAPQNFVELAHETYYLTSGGTQASDETSETKRNFQLELPREFLEQRPFFSVPLPEGELTGWFKGPRPARSFHLVPILITTLPPCLPDLSFFSISHF